ncbi:hypothetical protein [Arthrobacter sp. AQ5-05]|uniref:glutaredoxin family protein n=1 Tax=Arthrobacter sp. AQ5-05 TaxID=2184581 RepID=UPI00257099F5|nr:hypothetical protein [Arthrobacter sp. AQ5-05]
MELVLYTSAFCAPCVRARSVLRDAGKLLARANIREVDVPSHLAESEEAGIVSTPPHAGGAPGRLRGVPRLGGAQRSTGAGRGGARPGVAAAGSGTARHVGPG